MQTPVSNYSHQLRTLCRRPLAVIVVVLALTLGIAANTALVNLARTALVNLVLGSPLDRLLMLSERAPTGGNCPLIYSPADFDDLKRWNLSFAGLAAFDDAPQRHPPGLRQLGPPLLILRRKLIADFFHARWITFFWTRCQAWDSVCVVLWLLLIFRPGPATFNTTSKR